MREIENPFRNPQMRRVFDTAVAAYRDRDATLFQPDGYNRHEDSNMAYFFWRGYDYDSKLRQEMERRRQTGTVAYACVRAGRAVYEARHLKASHKGNVL